MSFDFSKSEKQDDLLEYVREIMLTAYKNKEKEVGKEQMRRLEKILLLRVVDELWMDHINAMEYLRDSVRLRAYGQRDPLVEYKIEGQKMFEQLMNGIKVQISNLIFKIGFVRQPQSGMTEEKRPEIISSQGPERLRTGPSAIEKNISQKDNQNTSGTVINKNKIGRNSPCPCGSGKKYKKCHGA